jgi:hypothetical protein
MSPVANVITTVKATVYYMADFTIGKQLWRYHLLAIAVPVQAK